MFASKLRLAVRRPLARALSTDVPAATASTSSTPATTTKQAPNYASTWTTNQRARPTAGEGPRFEQTVMELQPQPLSAMALIADEPVRMVHGRKAVCDGGASPSLWHTSADIPYSTPLSALPIRFISYRLIVLSAQETARSVIQRSSLTSCVPIPFAPLVHTTLTLPCRLDPER
jgi:NADH dehydrogenase (ubiquinone) Fe-S protein 6